MKKDKQRGKDETDIEGEGEVSQKLCKKKLTKKAAG